MDFNATYFLLVFISYGAVSSAKTEKRQQHKNDYQIQQRHMTQIDCEVVCGCSMNTTSTTTGTSSPITNEHTTIRRNELNILNQLTQVEDNVTGIPILDINLQATPYPPSTIKSNIEVEEGGSCNTKDNEGDVIKPTTIRNNALNGDGDLSIDLKSNKREKSQSKKFQSKRKHGKSDNLKQIRKPDNKKKFNDKKIPMTKRQNANMSDKITTNKSLNKDN